MATWPTITDDDGTGTTGTILDDSLFDSIRDYVGAAWASVAFNAGNYTADASMTFTVASGDVTTHAYVETGKTMTVALVIATATVGGVVSQELRVAIPNGRTAQKTTYGTFGYLDNGTYGTGLWRVSAGGTVIVFTKTLSGTNWTLSTNNTYLLANCTFEID